VAACPGKLGEVLGVQEVEEVAAVLFPFVA
jgi:hypothetical protein